MPPPSTSRTRCFPSGAATWGGKEVVAAEEFAAKIRAVADHRPDPDFLLVARTDALAVEGVGAAIDRVNRYVDAGADVAFVEAPRALGDIERIGREVRAPKLFNLAIGGVGPSLGVNELAELGFAWIVVPGVAMAAVMHGMRETGKRVLADRSDAAIADIGFSPRALAQLFGADGFDVLDKQYATEIPAG